MDGGFKSVSNQINMKELDAFINSKKKSAKSKTKKSMMEEDHQYANMINK